MPRLRVPALPDWLCSTAGDDRSKRYDQRYEILAPAWHVTDQTSLFDYGPGEFDRHVRRARLSVAQRCF